MEITGNLTQSIQFYNSAILHGFIDKKIIYNNLGNIFLQLDKIQKSVEFYSLALNEDSNNKLILNNLIKAQIKKRDIQSIEKLLNKAESIDKNYSEYLNNKAELLVLKKKFNEAIIFLKNLIKNNNDPKNFLLLSKIYFTIGKTDSGNNIINETAISFPDNISVINFKGMTDLYNGDFINGWKSYEFRRSALNKLYPEVKEWKGQNLENKRILVYNEQGIGDAIQFSKYLFPLSRLCKNIDFLVNEKLHKIFNNNIGINSISKKEITITKYDFKVPLA